MSTAADATSRSNGWVFDALFEAQSRSGSGESNTTRTSAQDRLSRPAVLADARSGMLTNRFHSERDEVDAQELEAALGD